MAITVKHLKVSTIPDAGDDTLVEPSDWNADHQLTGTVPVANGGTGASTLTGYVKGNGTAAMTAATTIPSTDVTGLGTMSTQNANNVAITGGTMSSVAITGYIPTTEKGVANGVATLDSGGTVPISQLPAAVLGALSYQGTWNASTNTPTLTSSVGTKGYYYVVNVAGSTNLNGITDWLVGDWAVFNGSVWQKVDNTDAVTSVNGYTGTVVLTQTDISGTVPTSRTLTAGTGLTGGGDLSANRTFAIDSTVATLTGTQTLTNKTLTAPKIDLINDTNGNEILGLSPTASATDFLTVKNGIGVGVPLHLYADGSSTNVGFHIQPKGTGLVTISDGTDFNKGIRFRSSSSAASAITLLDAVSSAGRVVTLPDATTTLVGRDTTDTLTNKSISGSTNTLSNIGNSSLTNSAITINGTSTSLGGSISVGTVTSVAATAGTGISISGSPITTSGTLTVTNTAPDQTVVLTAGTGISTTGTYPNFTITNTSPSSGGTVTSVTGTAPVVSSGGNTPAISMPAATTSVNGYLTSTDWTTFNGKYSVGGALGTPSSATLTNATGLPVGGISATGTPSSSTYLRGDGSWSSVTATLAASLAGGALGSIPYQSATNVTTFLAGNATTTPAFVTSIGALGLATAPILTSSTGSGNVVLATSPTLVTPALGTPSALVGTNITGTASGLSIGGNAATVTNGVYTTGSYADPTWITSLDGSKITGTIDGGTF